jgi:hypothetical protein
VPGSGALNRSGWTISAPRWALYSEYGLNLLPAQAIDGDAATRYATGSASFTKAAINNGGVQQGCVNLAETDCGGTGGGSNDYLALDLGAERTFEQIVFNAGAATTDIPAGFRVLLSRDDDVYWRVVAGTGAVVTSYCFNEPQTARYVRVELTQSITTYWWTVYELNLY